jgi:hypothetical protein
MLRFPQKYADLQLKTAHHFCETSQRARQDVETKTTPPLTLFPPVGKKKLVNIFNSRSSPPGSPSVRLGFWDSF